MAAFNLVFTVTDSNGRMGTLQKVVDVPSGLTRADIFSQTLDMFQQQMKTNRLNVLFFSLEPNELPVTG